MRNILIVGAHFDDTELGVGGTAAKLAESGAQKPKMCFGNVLRGDFYAFSLVSWLKIPIFVPSYIHKTTFYHL